MFHLVTFAFFAFGTAAGDARTMTAHHVVQSAQAPDTVILAGTYDLVIVVGGGQLDATLKIGYVRDSLTAVLMVGGDHVSPVRPGTRHGNKLKLEPTSAAMDVRYDLEFAGPKVSGTFVYQGESGTVTGKRREER